MIRMSRIMLHLWKSEEEPWLQWHMRTWRQSQDVTAKTWGCTPAVVVAACAASMVVRQATRSACSIVQRALGWRSHADAQVMNELGRGRMGEWVRRRTARAWWEDPWVKAFGLEWLLIVATVPNRQIAIALVKEKLLASLGRGFRWLRCVSFPFPAMRMCCGATGGHATTSEAQVARPLDGRKPGMCEIFEL